MGAHTTKCAENTAPVKCTVSVLGMVLVGLVLLGITTGCAAPGSSDSDLGSPDSVHFTKTQFEDIPVPYGYQMMERFNDSLAYERENMRIGRTKYRGRRESLDEVKAFYREHMSEYHGWTFEQENEEENVQVLSFGKSPYACDIKIYQKENYNYIEVRMDTIHES